MPTEAELLSRIEALEHELRAQRAQAETTATVLEQMMGQMAAFYWIVDRELRFVSSGGAIEPIVGIPSGTFLGHTIPVVVERRMLPPEAIEMTARACRGETTTFEIDYRGKLLATVIGPYRNAGGDIVGAVGTVLDVTAWRALENRMVDAQRAESLGVLASGLAHDFNNLLVAVLGNADLAVREINDGKSGRSAIENIQTASLRAAELVEQLLAYAGRGGAGTKRIEPRSIVDELLRISAPGVPDDIHITVDVSCELAVRGDPAQFRQVVLNLIANARDALTGRGGAIIVRGKRQQLTGETDPHDILSAAAGSYVVLEVEDNGPGMDSETRRHVFEPFYTTKQRGHGLGLAAVLGIVRAHGGGIRVISSPGNGARFVVMWPAAPTAESAATQSQQLEQTVLVIDDEDIVRDVLARMIEDLGYATLTAADGAAGLALLEHHDIHAVLVDLTMPHVSGADVLRILRERRPGLPVVVCSGYDRDGQGPIQADAYLAKPFRIDALERTLAKLLPLRNV